MPFIDRLTGLLPKRAARNGLGHARSEARERSLHEGAPATWLQLGIERYAAQRLEEAEACFREALRLQPDFPEARNNLGLVLRAGGAYAGAIEAFQAVLSTDPANADAALNLGQTYALLKDEERAEHELRRALSAQPDSADAHLALGALLHEQGRRDEAIAQYGEAARLQPTLRGAWHNLCVALQETGRHEEAVIACREGLVHLPDSHRLHGDLAYVLLRLGQYTQGWREYEWRLHGIDMPPAASGKPRWNGEALHGRTLLVHGEQGLGDVVMAARFLPMLAAFGGRIVFECAAPIHALLRHSGACDRIVSIDDPARASLDFDAWVPLLSVPGILGTTAATIPAPLRVDLPAAMVEGWAARMPAGSGLRVGLVWAGNPSQMNDRQRSMQPGHLARLVRVEGVQFFSLQVGQAGRVPPFPMHDLTGSIRDFADTAALVSRLDLVVSVDTGVAHVAASLGKSTWVLLPFAADWRYGLHPDRTPWYPAMRLFRQPRQGDWEEPVERVASALVRLAHVGA